MTGLLDHFGPSSAYPDASLAKNPVAAIMKTAASLARAGRHTILEISNDSDENMGESSEHLHKPPPKSRLLTLKP
jgi:hypothetical protein